MENRGGFNVNWRGRMRRGGTIDDMTHALRAIQARLESIETFHRRGFAAKAHNVSDEEVEDENPQEKVGVVERKKERIITVVTYYRHWGILKFGALINFLHRGHRYNRVI